MAARKSSRRKRRQYVKQIVPVFLKKNGNNYEGQTRSGKIRSVLNVDAHMLTIYNVPYFEDGQSKMRTVSLKVSEASTKNNDKYYRSYLPSYGKITIFAISGEFDMVLNVPWFVKKSM